MKAQTAKRKPSSRNGGVENRWLLKEDQILRSGAGGFAAGRQVWSVALQLVLLSCADQVPWWRVLMLPVGQSSFPLRISFEGSGLHWRQSSRIREAQTKHRGGESPGLLLAFSWVTDSHGQARLGPAVLWSSHNTSTVVCLSLTRLTSDRVHKTWEKRPWEAEFTPQLPAFVPLSCPPITTCRPGDLQEVK